MLLIATTSFTSDETGVVDTSSPGGADLPGDPEASSRPASWPLDYIALLPTSLFPNMTTLADEFAFADPTDASRPTVRWRTLTGGRCRLDRYYGITPYAQIPALVADPLAKDPAPHSDVVPGMSASAGRNVGVDPIRVRVQVPAADLCATQE